MLRMVVGLGNPTKIYQSTRHNLGYKVVELLSEKFKKKLKAGKGDYYYSKVDIGEQEIYLVKPTTFMNNSGIAVAYVKEKHKLNLKDIVVIYDDIDLPIGKMKISYDKSSGGHNGLESIIKKLKSREFLRIRIGISPATSSGKIKKPLGEEAVKKWILGEFKPSEFDILKKLSKKINKALETFVLEGKDKTMSVYN